MWYGHLRKMEECRIPNVMKNWKPEGEAQKDVCDVM